MKDTLLFDRFGLHENLLKSLSALGLETPTPIQVAVIPAIRSGQDIQASSETGSGKSVAFLLPILQRMLEAPAPDTATRCLVISPTRELALQLDKHCRDLVKFSPVNSLAVVGGELLKEQKAKLRKNPEIVVGTPGRLLEHTQKKSLLLEDLEFLVLDEADRTLDMGFQEEILEIVSRCNSNRQTILLSATLEHSGLGAISQEVQKQPQRIAIGTHRSAHAMITQEIILADDHGHKKQQCNWLLVNESFKKALVFTKTRDHAEEVAAFLIKQGRPAACLHGEMQHDERKQVMHLFRDGKVKVLVATDLAARGLDIPTMDLVINFAMARSGDDYVHRIGRTGRAGESGKAISLIGPQEWNLMESIQRYLKLSFTTRVIEELPARFSGPAKKKKSDKKSQSRKKGDNKEKPKAKERHRNRKNIGKRRTPTVSKEPSVNKEPSANKKPSASKEPSAGKEPSADRRPASAKKNKGGGDGFAPLTRK
ncbi:MAG: DEAD/DEAH box helicase [Gammaproteobacteria bacterium]|nr:DEAD/DEAH box helicase [Gammaproteobacteria bacterium]